MGMFNELIQLRENGEIVLNQWIEWNHILIPNKPLLLRKIMRKLMAFLGHCLECSALDGCYLLEKNKPNQPLHDNCDCNRIFINVNKVISNSSAELPIDKLTKYIFNGDINSKGKQKLFQIWGYTIDDVYVLQQIFESQARDNYIRGNYALKKLDQFGQRLSIPIDLHGKLFNSGWMLYPEGKIINITPFGGWIK